MIDNVISIKYDKCEDDLFLHFDMLNNFKLYFPYNNFKNIIQKYK